MENSSVKMTPAFLILGKVLHLYLSQSFMDTNAQSYCTRLQFCPFEKSFKLLTTSSLCVYPYFQDCSQMSAKFTSSSRRFLLSACLTNHVFTFLLKVIEIKKILLFTGGSR